MDLNDYVDVPTRMRLALERWPDLRLVEAKPELVDAGGHLFVSVTVTVWRTADDPLPCTATAWEPFPGRTAFTKDSEMMNASTSAVGRALGLMGIGIRSSIATANEVRNRQAERPMVPDRPDEYARAIPRPAGTVPPASDKQKAFILRLAIERGVDVDVPADLNIEQAKVMIDELKAQEPIK